MSWRKFMRQTKEIDIREDYCEYVNPHLGELLIKVGLDKVFIEGKGAYLLDNEGESYLDFLSNYGANVLGHNHPPLKAAIAEYLATNEPAFMQPSLGREATKLAKKIVGLAPQNLGKVIYTNSGAESIELCIKVARAATGRQHVLTAVNSFHGKTISALSATGQSTYQKPYQLPLPGFHYVPFGDIDALENFLKAYGETLAAFILEPIQGEGGVVQAKAEYFSAAQELCQGYGVKFIADEVQTGIGRAGHMFYSNHLNLQPDAIALAKGLGGGLVPIGAVLLSDEIYSEDIGLTHSSTFAGGGLACKVGNAVINELCANEYAILKQVREVGAYLKEKLICLAQHFPGTIKAVKGDGLMLGIEFNVSPEMFKSDRGSLLGVIGNSGKLLPLLSGYLANVHRIRVAPTLNNQATLRVQPPLNVTREQCDIFCKALKETIGHLAPGNTYALIQYLFKSEPKLQRDTSTEVEYKFQTQPTESDGRFGFLIHPLTLKSFEDYDSSLKGLSPTDIRELVDSFEGQFEPTIVGSTRITAKNGKTIYGEFAAVTYLPEQLMRMPREKALGYIRDAVIMLKERGAKIVGLGGYTSIVSKAGKRMSNLGVAVTTGNNYTVLSAIQAVNMAFEKFATESQENLHVAMVGAGGSVGSTITREIALSVNHITLIGNGRNVDKTRRRFGEMLMDLSELLCKDKFFCTGIQPNSVAERLKALLEDQGKYNQVKVKHIVDEIIAGKHDGLGIFWGTDTQTLLPQVDVTFVATNSTDILIHPHYLKRNAIVCDLSRPSNVNQSISLHRPDVFMIDGGVIQTPRLDDLGVNFGFPKGLCFACMAETMMLAFDRRYQNTSLGAKLKYEDQAYFKCKAKEYGFSIAGFRSFDFPITEAAMERIYHARQQGRIDKALGGSFEDYGNINRFLLEQYTGVEDPAIAFYDDISISYDDAYQQVKQYAAAYKHLGCVKKDRVAILSQGEIESIFAILGCFQIGAVAVVLNPHNSDSEIATILAQTTLKLLVDGREKPNNFSIHTVSLNKLSELAKEMVAGVQPVFVVSDYPAAIFCTPGSTGSPKKVCHSHGNIFNTFKNYGRGVLGLSHKDRLFSTSKCFFIYGFKCVYLGLAGGGGVILAPSKPTSEAMEKISRALMPTYIFSVPTIYLRFLKEPIDPSAFTSVKYFISAGEPLPRDVYDRWYQHYNKKILDSIGTTESMCFVISNYPEDINPGSTGKPVPGYQVKLINEFGDEVRTGELGILWIKGSTVVDQYVDVDPEKYKNCFVDGWFKTNDVFYKNDMGWYYFQGRANDMVKVGGEWLSPYLLEETLNKHPWVKCSAVTLFNQVGLLNRPIAYVVPQSDDIDHEELICELKSYSRKILARNQYPHIIEVIDKLPKTQIGKLKRYMLKINENQSSKYLESTAKKLVANT